VSDIEMSGPVSTSGFVVGLIVEEAKRRKAKK
jgi:hypothetical protein